MLRIIIVLIRVFLGVLLAVFAVLSAMTGLYFLANQSARVFGSGGVLLLLGLLIAAGLSAASWKLLGTALRPSAAPNQPLQPTAGA